MQSVLKIKLCQIVTGFPDLVCLLIEIDNVILSDATEKSFEEKSKSSEKAVTKDCTQLHALAKPPEYSDQFKPKSIINHLYNLTFCKHLSAHLCEKEELKTTAASPVLQV